MISILQGIIAGLSGQILGNHVFISRNHAPVYGNITSGNRSVEDLSWKLPSSERFFFRRGWYMLELLVMTRKDVSQQITVRFEFANFVVPLSVGLSCRSGKVAKRIVWLPGALTTVSVEADTKQVDILSSKLQFKRLLKGFATQRMLIRLSKKYPEYYGASPETIRDSLDGGLGRLSEAAFAKKLYSLYQASFPSGVCSGESATLVSAVPDSALRGMLEYPQVALDPISNVFDPNSLDIHWVTCDFAPRGGGGNMTIFRFIRWFELFGHQQHIWLHNKTSHSDAATAYENLVRNYQQVSAQIHFIVDEPEAFKQAAGDIIVATDWESVWPVLSVPRFKRRFYFVQDHEPSFFPAGAHSLAAAITYREELDCICAGPWLEKLMREQYGRWATKFWLAADCEVYYPPDSWPDNRPLRIAFYARGATSRRAVELGFLALEYLFEQGGADFHVDFFGGSENQVSLQQFKFSWTDHGVLSAEELGELYRCCDIGMIFSATNYSLVPQEMMACRLAVLEIDGDNTRSVFSGGGIVLAEPHPRRIAEQLYFLLNNKAKRRSVADRGMEWAFQFDWEEAARNLNSAILQRLSDLGCSAQDTN